MASFSGGTCVLFQSVANFESLLKTGKEVINGKGSANAGCHLGVMESKELSNADLSKLGNWKPPQQEPDVPLVGKLAEVHPETPDLVQTEQLFMFFHEIQKNSNWA